MKTYAKLMTDSDAELLQEASADVVYLTDQGYSPTEAIVKVASAAKFPLHKTRLLIYAYSNGVAAEKRAELGGPFERLGAFPLPDASEVERRLYAMPADTTTPQSSGESSEAEKTASFSAERPLTMDIFQTDLAGKSRKEIHNLLGMTTKAASDGEEDCEDEEETFTDDEGRPTGKGVSITRTIVTIGVGRKPRGENGECDCQEEDCAECYPPEASTLQEELSRHIPQVPKSMLAEIEPALLGLLKGKKEAMAIANQEADEAYSAMTQAVAAFQKKIEHWRTDPQYKRAGLLSVRAYYPEVGNLLQSCVSEVTAQRIKMASHSPGDITIRHPWVEEAKELDSLIQVAADKTVEANRKNAEYKTVCEMYQERDELRESFRKSAGILPFLTGAAVLGKGSPVWSPFSLDPEAKAKEEQNILGSLDDKLHEMNLRDIETTSMINDFSTNDEILSAYPPEQLLRGFNELLRTAPETMRNKPQARALLQQYMTQGRMAPTELMPALEMNKMDPRRVFYGGFAGGGGH